MCVEHEDFEPTTLWIRPLGGQAPGMRTGVKTGWPWTPPSSRPALLAGAALCVLLGSCASAPKPPTVDESRKRPANVQAHVDLQACRSDLQNERLARRDAERQVEASQALVRLLVVQMQARSAASASAASAEADAAASGTAEATPASNSSRAAQAEAGSASNPERVGACLGRVADTALGDAGSAAASGNGIYIVRFDFGSARLQMPAALTASLVEEAKQAPLVLLRGRTDGSDDAWGEARIARERTEAVRDYLVGHGVPADRIRSTWQASGDHVADNRSTTGRDLNRRVEIEIYRQLPVALNPPQARWR